MCRARAQGLHAVSHLSSRSSQAYYLPRMRSLSLRVCCCAQGPAVNPGGSSPSPLLHTAVLPWLVFPFPLSSPTQLMFPQKLLPLFLAAWNGLLPPLRLILKENVDFLPRLDPGLAPAGSLTSPAPQAIRPLTHHLFRSCVVSPAKQDHPCFMTPLCTLSRAVP